MMAARRAGRFPCARTRIQPAMLRAEAEEGTWDPPIVKTSAVKGEGIDKLIAVVAKHLAWLRSSGELNERLRTIAGEEVAARAKRAPAPRR